MKDVTYDKFDFQSVKYTAHILLFMIALMFERISQIWHSNKYNNRFFERYVCRICNICIQLCRSTDPDNPLYNDETMNVWWK